MEIIMLLFGMVALFGFVMWRKRKKAKTVASRVVPREGNLYVQLTYSKIGGKQPPPRLWPQPFESVEAIDDWWASREDLWEGVDKVELAKC